MSVVRFMDSVADDFPDDSSSKDVYVQAEGRKYSGLGDRHVLLWWTNGTYDQGEMTNLPTTQILQLTGHSGNYNYYHPVVKKRKIASMEMNQQFFLGTFTRAQRDKIIELANGVKFSKTSTVNGCRVWMRDLFDAMVRAGLITASTFNTVVVGVPLPQRVAEALT
ncbi:hypothetical protein ACEPAG_9194 [Sanghuangporus baumii]